MPLVLPLVLATAAVAADPILPAGRDVENAIYLDLTRYAIQHREDVFESFLPTSVPLDGLVGDQLNQGDLIGSSLLGVEYEFSIENLIVYPTLDYVTVTPKAGPVCRERPGSQPDIMDNGYLQVDLGIRLALNSPGDPARAHIGATLDILGLGISLVDDDCDIWLDPTPATATVRVSIGYPRDDDDWGNQDDGNVDPFKTTGGAPSFCPYDATTWAIAAAANGIEDPCHPLFVDIKEFSWRFGNDDQGVELSDIDINCGAFVDFVKDLATGMGLLPEDIIASTLQSAADPQIDAAITDAETGIRDAISDLFPQSEGFRFSLEPPLDLLGAQIGLELCPTEVVIDDRGLRIGIGGQVPGPEEPAACVEPYDPGGSKVTIPPTGAKYTELGKYWVTGVDDVLHEPQTPAPNNPPQISFGVNDDFMNQALYGVWRGGLLCQELSGDSSALDLPITFDTALLNTLSGSAFEGIFDSDPVTGRPLPLLVRTRPEKPPVAALSTSGPDAAVVDLQAFGIDMYAPAEHRLVRAVGMVIAAQPGIGLDFDTNTGSLGAAINLDADTLAPTVTYNELAPQGSATLEAGMGELIGTFVGPLLDSALGELKFDLPAFAGLGVQTLDLEAAGPGHDWLGAFGNIGFVPYADPTQTGCDLLGTSGGAAGSCGGGCSSAPAANRIAMLVIPLLVALRRRRR